MSPIAEHQRRLVALAAREAALREVLIAYSRVIENVRRANGREGAAVAGFAELHAWLTEAGREVAIELTLLKQADQARTTTRAVNGQLSD